MVAVQICQLPHIHVRVTTDKGADHRLMLIVDTGFVGAAVILSATAAARLGLSNRCSGTSSTGFKSLLGIGHKRVDMMCSMLEIVDICGHEVSNVDVLCSTSVSALQPPSAYADGFVGMDLLGRFDLWLDVMHERIALKQ